MTRTRELADIGPGAQTGNRNVLINGGFDFWQRGTSLSSSGGGVGVDMWRQYTDVGSGTQSRDTSVTVPGVASQSYKFTVGGSATNFSLWQIIESANCEHLAGRVVTLSFYAQVSSARSLNVTLASSTATNAVWTGTWTTFSTTAVSIGTSMARYTVTTTIPSNMKTMNVGFGSGGTNFAASSTLNITGVQLEVGSVATPFEKRPVGMELALCQRHYQNFTTPSGTSDFNFPVVREASTVAVATVFLPVTLRAIPTLVGSNLGRMVFRDTNFAIGGVPSVSSIAISSNGPSLSAITLIIGHTAVGGGALFSEWDVLNTTTNLGFSAEL